MSAYICDNCHLTALAAYAVHHLQWRPLFDREMGQARAINELGAILLAENVKSVTSRYGESDGNATFVPCSRCSMPSAPSIQIIKAAHCYAYQACEHEGWIGSAAMRVVEDSENHAVRQLPGYAEAVWGIPAHAHPKQ